MARDPYGMLSRLRRQDSLIPARRRIGQNQPRKQKQNGEDCMVRETEGPSAELNRGDRGLQESLVSGSPDGRSRRGFLGGTGLAAMGAIVGGAMPFSETSGISAAQAQGASAAPKGP